MNSIQTKSLIISLGADICGIAPVERFDKAPKGFHPTDILPDTKSVIVFGKQVPSWVMFAKSPVPFTNAEDVSMYEVWHIGINAAIALENEKMKAVPVPSEPYEYWDKETMTAKGILSLKHAGQLAGLGILGRNTLLYTPRFGCMVKLGALLVAEELEPDMIIKHDMGCDNCQRCVSECPSGAIQENTVLQKPCRQYAYITNERGYHLMVCNTCRRVCPNYKGFKVA
jgi:epoxyqueuosine reductase